MIINNFSHVGWVKRSETQHHLQMLALGFVPPPNLLKLGKKAIA
ncbi:hypothetical protein [Limnospira platensis]